MTPAFDSWSAFFAMGTHGVYVWSAWLLVILLVSILIWLSRQQRKQLRRQVTMQINVQTEQQKTAHKEQS